MPVIRLKVRVSQYEQAFTSGRDLVEERVEGSVYCLFYDPIANQSASGKHCLPPLRASPDQVPVHWPARGIAVHVLPKYCFPLLKPFGKVGFERCAKDI